jgi:serine/threonine-protein kinase
MQPRYGSYEPIKRLAVGGMGEIFLARQVGIHGFERLAIIKTLLMEAQDDEDRIELFLTEARVAGLLNHPNVVQIFEVGESEGTYYIAMEYVDGDTLSSLVRAALKQGRHTPWPFLSFIAQAARALHHAHNQRDPAGNPMCLVHRDISPQNIMVRRDGVTKVVDFGIAKVANSGHRTRTGVVKGKMAYMAPEQMRADPVDARSDLFSLGVVLWELTVGRRMFLNMSDVEIISHVMAGRLPSPSEVVEGYLPALEAVVMKSVAMAPEDRFQSGNEMADALEAVLEQVPAEEKVPLADYVESLVGDAVRERTADLTPSAEISGIMSAHPRRVTGQTGIHQRQGMSSAAKAGLGAAITLLVSASALGVWFLLAPPPPPPPPPVVADPTPPPPPPAPPPVDPAPPPADPAASGAEPPRAVDKDPDKDPDRKRGGTTKKTGPRPPADPKPAPQPAPAGATQEDGYLTLAAEPWAVVVADGRPIGSTPLFKVRLPAGKHTLQLNNDAQGLSKTMTVIIEPGKVKKVEVQLDK